jgi:hypothetical protein
MEDFSREPLINGEQAVRGANARSPARRQAEAAHKRRAPKWKKLEQGEAAQVSTNSTHIRTDYAALWQYL